MNLAQLIPLILNKKKWLSVVIALLAGYQTFSPNGFGARLGIPSYDTFYKQPRDILVDRVESARDAQQETAEQFTSALEKFKAVTQFDGGDLEKRFNILNSAFERSEQAADEINQRVDQVVKASNNLLEEWRDELKQYHDPSIRQQAEQQFDSTRRQADKLISAMRKAEQKTQPVLSAFRDQVLFVKHNLNMRAINSISQQTVEIERDVSNLIKDMQASIAEANTFIDAMLKQNQ